MQNTGFTLVELIVVITILAILGTIAFISLQGYGAEAKNSKVTSDIRNLVSAIETKRTRDSITLGSLVTNAGTSNEIATSSLVASTTNTGWVALSASNYAVGNIDFSALGQNGSDFKDPNNGSSEVDYVFGYTSGTNLEGDSFGYYQLAGQIVDNDIKKARVNGSYVSGSNWGTVDDVTGILSATEVAGAASTVVLNDGATIGVWWDTDNLY